MDTRGVLARVGSAVNPLLGRDVADYLAARDAFAATAAEPRVVGVLGLTPGEGRSSVSALLALAVAGWSDRRVEVLDAAPADPSRSVTTLLGGDQRQSRLPALLTAPHQRVDVVSRARLRHLQTPSAVVPVLAMPAGAPIIDSPAVARTLRLLRHRADLVVIDTPAGPVAPPLPAVLDLIDHAVLVVRGDGDVDRRLQAVSGWLAAARRGPSLPVTVVIVSRAWSAPRWADVPMPVVVVPRDEGLRRREPARLGRQAMTAGLSLAAQVFRTPTAAPAPPQDDPLAGEAAIFGRR